MVVLRGKCVVVGDCGVGKSSVVQTFVSDGSTYPKNYKMTTQVDVISKYVYLGKGKKDFVDMFLFDTSGQPLFREMTEIHFDQLGMYLIVFDVTNKQSFSNCEKWLKEIKKFMEADKTVPGVLIGNKTDNDRRRVVTEETAKQFASKHGMEYFECSAKDFVGVEAPFQWLADKFYKLHSESPSLIQQMEY